MGVEHRFEAAHDLGRLYRVRAGSDLEVQVGVRQLQILEQPAVHVCVVMLPGMHQQRRRDAGVPAEGADQGRHLHVVWARADHAQDGSQSLRKIAHYDLSSLFCFSRGSMARISAPHQVEYERERLFQSRQPECDIGIGRLGVWPPPARLVRRDR